MGAAEDKLSIPDLLRAYLIRALTSGGGTGSDVNVTNSFITTHQDNPTANPETGLAKDATFSKDADGGIVTHVQNFPASPTVDGFGAAKVKDEYTSAIHLDDQTGANAVLTFDFGTAVSLYIITSIGGTSRASSTATAPTATKGIVCIDGAPTYVPVANAGVVKVYAPTGSVVSCSGLVRS